MPGRQQQDSTPEERAQRIADLPHIDRLGPLSREVVRNSPIDIWVAQAIAMSPMGLMNPETGAIDDAGFARWLEGEIRRKMAGKGPYQPLVPRRRDAMTPKSLGGHHG